MPVAIAPHSPLMGRLAVDGSELRAMFGTLWFVLPGMGVILGGMAAAGADGLALPPPLWIIVAGAILIAKGVDPAVLAVWLKVPRL